MHLHIILFLALPLALPSVLCSQFPDGQVQPGCYPPPALPQDFSTEPHIWRSATSWTGSKSGFASRRSARVWNGWSSIKYLFSLFVTAGDPGNPLLMHDSGDSYTSTGFQIHGEQPNPTNPLGNPAYPGSTSANGPNYVDFLTTTYNRSYIQTYNLGFGGATVDPSLIASPFGNIVQSFQQQLQEEFIPTYARNPAVPWAPADTLFTLFFGINDLILSYGQRNESLNFAVIKSYEALIQQLYDAGARNFLIMNVPPIDRAPGSAGLSETDRSYQAGYIGLFNFYLQYLALNLASNFPDTTVFQLDTNWLFTLAINNPDSFAETSAFQSSTSFCEAYQRGTPTLDWFDPSCAYPVDKYLWLNDIHPTYPMHNFIASQIIKVLEG